MDPSRPSQLLRGKRVALLFYESSTRTRTSFEFAAKTLGATTTLVTPISSSIEKGESLIDTGWTVANLGADAIVMRHANSGAPYLLARYVPVPDRQCRRWHASASFASAARRLDHYQPQEAAEGIARGDCGRCVSQPGGALQCRRCCRASARTLSSADRPISCREIAATLAPGVTACHDLDAALQGADVVMALRVQKERLAGKHLSVDDYIANYQITPQRMKLAKPDAILMHPGPVIRGMELTSEVADGPQSCIHEQVRNGVKTRMAILAMLLGAAR